MPCDRLDGPLDRFEFRNRYLAAFRAANPGSAEPQLNYESGWWVFRYRATGYAPQRHRRREMDEMLARLEARDA